MISLKEAKIELMKLTGGVSLTSKPYRNPVIPDNPHTEAEKVSGIPGSYFREHELWVPGPDHSEYFRQHFAEGVDETITTISTTGAYGYKFGCMDCIGEKVIRYRYYD